MALTFGVIAIGATSAEAVVPCSGRTDSIKTSYNIDCKLVRHYAKDVFEYYYRAGWVGPSRFSELSTLPSKLTSSGHEKQYYG